MDSTYFAIHPSQFKTLDTEAIRNSFLISNLFQNDLITHSYTHYDRMIVGGVLPITKSIHLQPIEELKASYFLERREIGIINVGDTGVVIVNGKAFKLGFKEALYIGRGVKEVIFEATSEGTPRYYYNSAPAHTTYPTKKVTLEEAESVTMGSMETANQRTIRKLLVNSVLPTCQLQMGLTEIKSGSVWNTMPAHTHTRRMEIYLYFELPEEQSVCHFLGQPQETRHIWVKNNQAVLSPPWSIHSGAGTSNYSFIWSMAGENLDYGDMDVVKPIELE